MKEYTVPPTTEWEEGRLRTLEGKDEETWTPDERNELQMLWLNRWLRRKEADKVRTGRGRAAGGRFVRGRGL
jgi:hypothetical protein